MDCTDKQDPQRDGGVWVSPCSLLTAERCDQRSEAELAGELHSSSIPLNRYELRLG
jgi:hypothetical protein